MRATPGSVVLAIVLTVLTLFTPNVRATAAGSASFTADQAAHGAKIFGQNCAECHGAKLQGVSAPALRGHTSGFARRSVAEAYVYVSQQMPMTAPGSLSSTQYEDIMAYLLEQNGRKPAARPLTAASAKSSDATVDSR